MDDPENYRPGIKNRKAIWQMLKGSLLSNFHKSVPVHSSVNADDLTNPDKLTLVYVGHATVYLNFYGTRILTDPIFAERITGFIRRHIAPGIGLSQIRDLDLAVISHPHFDHFDRWTLRQLGPRTKHLIIPQNSADLINGFGFGNIIEARWDQEITLDQLKVMPFRPAHWGSRLPWEKMQRGYCSYVFSKNSKSILFAGDSAYTEAFQKISKQFPVNLALLPIGAYNPPEFQRFHMSPQQAAQVFEETKAEYLIPIHWGTFQLSLEPMDEPPQLLQKSMQERGLSDKLRILHPGEKFEY